MDNSDSKVGRLYSPEEIVEWKQRKAIHEAARLGNNEEIQQLLQQFPDLIEAVSPDINPGGSPLFTAVWHHHLQTVELLLSFGANPYSKNNLGHSLIFMLNGRNGEFIQSLIQRFPLLVTISDNQGRTALHSAIGQGFIKIAIIQEIIETLLKQGLEIDALDHQGQTALYQAVENNKIEIVSFLLTKGANPNLKYPTRSLLELAVEHKKYAIAKILLEASADFTVTDEEKMTLLHLLAKQRGDLEFTRMLLEKGIDPNAKDIDGWTPLHWWVMMEGNNEDFLKLMLEYGADINAQDKYGQTSLMICQTEIKEGNIEGSETLKLLKKYGGIKIKKKGKRSHKNK